jgi:HlyD family secretion protein
MEDKGIGAGFGFGRWAKLAVPVAAALALLALLLGRSSGESATEVPLYTVERGPLTISLTENGTIQNREKVVISSEVEGRSTIVFLVQEGRMVAEGDLLVKLDSSQLEDNRIDQEITVQNADASLIQARENLAIVKNQSQADIDQADLDLKFAELDLKKYMEGEYPMELQKAESNIKLAEEELKNAEDQYEWSKKLADKGYITGVELKSDELSVERQQISVETAKGEMELLRNYTHDRQIEKLRSDVSQKRMALERVKRKARADVVNAEADLRAREAQNTREKNKLDKINSQIAKCEMRAPTAGMVVYAESGGGRWRGNAQPLDVGEEVSERQELIHLPKTSRMDARIQVQESSLTKIRTGLPVVVKVSALDNAVIEGVLTKIAIMPDATRSWLNPDLKVYNCEVQLENSHPDLRPGMSCSATIIIEEYEDVIYCPIQSVVRVDGRPTVYVLTGARLEPRAVEIGLDNNRMLHILSGLAPGEQISLAPPLAESEKRASSERARPDEAGGAERGGRTQSSGGAQTAGGGG